MKTATGNAVIRAYSKAAKRLLADSGLTATSESAGFIIPDGQKCREKTGIQVFVKVCRYSDRLLREQPMTGGLLCEIRKMRAPAPWRKS
jgi:hypothetical protein